MLNNQVFLDGKAEAEKLINSLKQQIAQKKMNLSLAVILVGNNPASKVYVNIKEKRAKELGVEFKKYILPATVSENKILTLINKLNNNKKITGILLQLPLPKKFKTNKIIQAIDIKKDVDGLCPSLLTKERGGVRLLIISPTIQAISHLIKLSKIRLAGKKAVILCHSQEFAQSLKQELCRQKISVDVLLKPPIKTHNSLSVIHYSIVIIALGKKYFLKSKMIKKNAVIIDVGINRVDKKIFGDVDPRCFKKTKYISPVPGGVGPLTVAYLFKNLIKLK